MANRTLNPADKATHPLMLRLSERDFSTLRIIAESLGTNPPAFIRTIIEDMRDPLEAMADACSTFQKGEKLGAYALLRRTLDDVIGEGRRTKARL